MSNIRMSEDKIRARLRMFQTDPHLHLITHLLERLYQSSSPIGLIYRNGDVVIQLEPEAQAKVDKLHQERKDYIEATYADLITFEVLNL